ncbi:MAG: DNA primase [Bacteroidia bacterium]|nr:DNA primase [Bacteroidia bacterium]
MIDQLTIDRIMDAARIEEVVGEFVTLRKRGINYTGLCPFHDEKTPSFSVSPTRGICKCFSCGKGGNVVHFIMEHEQLSYYDGLKWLARKYHIEVVEKELNPEEQQVRNDRESMFILNEFARDYYLRTLHEHIDGKSIGLGYFKERGFREDIIRKFQLGFSLEERSAFSKEAVRKGYSKDFLLKTGLSLANEQGELHDRYRARVMFPVHTLSGKVVAFGGRILKKDEKAAKYVNSPESEIYHKSNELYGIYFAKQAIAKNDRCFLVEGYTDVISMHQAGIENVVSSSGTALTHGQIRMIHRFTKNVTVLYDGDAAGIKASLKGINLLLEEGLNIKVLLLPDGEDPDSFAKKHSSTDFIQYLKDHETDFIRFKTEILLKDAGNDPIKRAGLIQDLVESISLIADDITRSVYIKECSRQLDFDENLLHTEVNKKRYNQLQREQQKRTALSNGLPTADRRNPLNAYVNQGGKGNSGGIQVGGRPNNTVVVPIAPTHGTALDDDQFGPPPSEEYTAGSEQDFMGGPVQQSRVTVQPFIPTKTENPYDEFERNILKQVLRHGAMKICDDENEDGSIRAVSVTEFILANLATDEIEMHHPLIKKMLEEAADEYQKPGYNPERHFLNHREPEISLMAADLITEPYELSKYHARYQKLEKDSEKLDEIIPRVLEDLKNAIIQNEGQALAAALKKAQRDKDEPEIDRLSHEIVRLQQTKSELGKRLGERIVVR